MRILLLHPFNSAEQYHYCVPQVALGYLSDALKKNGFQNIDVQDAQVQGWSVTETLKYVEKTQPEIVGLRVWSHQLNTVRHYLRGIKRILPHTKIVVGGPHMTVAPTYVEMVDEVDFGIVGEAEVSFPLLVAHLSGKKVDLTTIPGLAYYDGQKYCYNSDLKEKNLDKFGVDWEILNLPLYHSKNSKTTAYDHGDKKNCFIFTTRGCPYPCTYCAAGIMNGKPIREHSAEYMMEELQKLYSQFGIRHFNIMDDNFTFHKRTVVEFCEAFLKNKSKFKNVTFHNPNGVRVDRLDDEMLALMKKCGWRWLHIGVESGSPRVLQKMRKHLDLEVVKKNVAKIKKHGMKCWGFFILGYPDETLEDMETTVNFAVKSDLTAATFSLFSPIPGTQIYKELVEAQRIPADYNMTGYNSPKEWVFAENVNGEQLQKLQRKALLRFYWRPDRAFYLLQGMELKTFGNRFKTIFLNPLFQRPTQVRRAELNSST